MDQFGHKPPCWTEKQHSARKSSPQDWQWCCLIFCIAPEIKIFQKNNSRTATQYAARNLLFIFFKSSSSLYSKTKTLKLNAFALYFGFSSFLSLRTPARVSGDAIQHGFTSTARLADPNNLTASQPLCDLSLSSAHGWISSSEGSGLESDSLSPSKAVCLAPDGSACSQSWTGNRTKLDQRGIREGEVIVSQLDIIGEWDLEITCNRITVMQGDQTAPRIHAGLLSTWVGKKNKTQKPKQNPALDACLI